MSIDPPLGAPPDRSRDASPSLPGAERIPPVDQRQRGYRLRFARTQADLEAVQRLRFEVFNLELGEGLAESYVEGLDRDPFDAQCQHLMVLEEASASVVGTYRIQLPEAAERGIGFYSATEFDLSHLPLEVRAQAIELGRACVAREHRSRNVLFLLWRGLASYVLWNKRRYYFGCSSLTSQDPDLGAATYRWLEQRGHVHPTIHIPPRNGFECVPSGRALDVRSVEIPTLFGIYLRYGAVVLGPPAIDRAFGTIDFLTLIDVSAIDRKTFESFAG